MISKDRTRLFGLGLRKPHYRQFVEGSVPVDFVEVISENFMVEGGRPLVTLSKVRENYPVALHGVSLSLGSVSGLNEDHFQQLQLLIDRVDPLFVSDHLCWTGYGKFNSHDLLPLPYTEEALSIVSRNVIEAQGRLNQQILVENPTSYVTFDHSSMSEWEFIRELSRMTGCGLLLDVNNVFVSAMNHGFDALQYIQALKGCDVRQIHLAGHDDAGPIRIDTHDRMICGAVWDLYRAAIALFPEAATMIERDDQIPPIEWLLVELDQARVIAGRAAVLVH
jgi:uncharacterized protein (UPF0276 family)